MLSRKDRTIRFALVFLCLMALLGAQIPGGTSHKARAQSKGDDGLKPDTVFACTNCPISIPSTFPAPTAASPYPANITVSGLTGGLASITVTITGWTTEFPDDIDMALVSPGASGRAFEFASDAGLGFGGVIGSFTLSDLGATALPDGTAIVSGTTYRPADYSSVETSGCPGSPTLSACFPANAGLTTPMYHPAPNGSATLTSVFKGLSGTGLNGVWKVYIVDDAGGSATDTITSVSIDITASGPTADGSTVSGIISADDGSPVAGTVVNMSGSQTRKTITNANGYYQFDQVETSGFYTVTPTRANYDFSPSNQSFSQLGNHTNAAFTGSTTGNNRNPLDTPEYFVRQQYLDVLGREPDEGGFNYWSNEITGCGADSACVDRRRREVAASFFIATEFQDTGSYIYDMYKGAMGRRPVFSEYSADRRTVIGGPTLETQKATFADNFVQRAEFVQKYQSKTTGDSFVDALLATVSQSAGVDLSGQRSDLIAHYNAGANMNQSRSLVLQELADNPTLRNAEYNAAFVLTEYFSYLQRNPEPEGYDFWLNVLNNGDVGNYPGMVCSFITSTEYQNRFSPVVTHTNAECGH